MCMLYPTTTILPEDRDVDGMYPIEPGCLHIFPFTAPYFGKQTITLKHAYPNSQDWSIGVSCVDSLDMPVIIKGVDINEFNIDRSDTVLEIWGGTEDPTAISVDPTRTYYLRVLNMQNRPNGYQLTFSYPVT